MDASMNLSIRKAKENGVVKVTGTTLKRGICMAVSIILSTRQCTGNNDVEVIGACEKEYNQLALYAFAGDVIKMARNCGASLIPWTKELKQQQFAYVSRLENEQKKREFLNTLFTSA